MILEKESTVAHKEQSDSNNKKEHLIHQKVAHCWDKNAEHWQLASESGYDVWRDKMNTPAFLAMLPDISEQAGLDIGCGDGYNSRLIAQQCCSLVAIDISQQFLNLNQAHKDNPSNLTFQEANATSLPFRNEHFDFVVGVMSFMDMAEIAKVFNEIYRVLRPGGFFQFSITHPCFNEHKGEWITNDKGQRTGFLAKDYFYLPQGEVHQWQHPSAPQEIKNFVVPRFSKPLSHWLNLIVAAGFMLEVVQEPFASDEIIAEFPELASTQIVAHSLIIRVRKDESRREPLRSIIERLPGNVWWKDKDLRYLGCNDNVLAMLKLSREDFIGTTDHDLWERPIADKLQAADSHILKTGETLRLEEVIVQADGTKAVMLTNKTPLRDKEGTIIGILGTSIDISDRKKAQRLLIEKTKAEQAQEEAEKYSQKLKAMSGSLAHEVRTPICGLKLGFSVLEKRIARLFSDYKAILDSGVVDKTAMLSNEDMVAMETMLTRLSQQLDISESLIDIQLKNIALEKIDSSHFTLSSMLMIVGEVLSAYPFSPEERSLVFCDIQSAFEFNGDPTLMKYVLWNLIKNAMYFIKAEEKGEILIWTTQSNDFHYLHVKDTAKGISPEHAKKIFDRFYTQRQGGTGLGLAFCKMVMEAFGGDIICRAEEDKYAEFILSFPKLSLEDKEPSN